MEHNLCFIFLKVKAFPSNNTWLRHGMPHIRAIVLYLRARLTIIEGGSLQAILTDLRDCKKLCEMHNVRMILCFGISHLIIRTSIYVKIMTMRHVFIYFILRTILMIHQQS